MYLATMIFVTYRLHSLFFERKMIRFRKEREAEKLGNQHTIDKRKWKQKDGWFGVDVGGYRKMEFSNQIRIIPKWYCKFQLNHTPFQFD